MTRGEISFLGSNSTTTSCSETKGFNTAAHLLSNNIPRLAYPDLRA